MKGQVTGLEGKVNKFFEDRGFGFLNVEGERETLFFHINNVKDDAVYSVVEGQKMRFDKRNTPKGTEAYNIELI